MLLYVRMAVLVCCVVFVCPTYAQERGAAKVYKDQFLGLHAKAKAWLDKADKLIRSDSPEAAILDAHYELFALTKLVHRLGEEAGQSNLDGLNNGQRDNKTLLLVSAGCEELSFVLQVLSNYLDTGDRVFLELAKRGEDIIGRVEYVL